MPLQQACGSLKATPPFVFARSLDYLCWFRPLAMEAEVSDNAFARAWQVAGQTVFCQVAGRDTAGEPTLDYALRSRQPIDRPRESTIRERLAHFLGLADDLTEFYALAQGDPDFLPVLESLHGYHQVKFPSPFEAAVWAVLSQRNRMTTARNMLRNLVEGFGHPIEVGPVTYRAFPEPHELAGRDEGDLAFVARNLRRGEFLIDVARAFALMPPDLLQEASYEEAERWLLDIKGIGPWSARFVLLRGVGRYEQVPAEDRAILEAATRVYGGGRTVTPQEVRQLAARYGPWQGYWAHYLRVAVT